MSGGFHRVLLTGVLALILSEGGCALTSPRTPAGRDDDGIERVAFRARQFRGDTPVLPSPDGSIVAEAEEFRPVAFGAWRPGDWGDNYYAATMSNTFLSRKAFLGAPEQCDRSEAAITVRVSRAGRYLALVLRPGLRHRRPQVSDRQDHARAAPRRCRRELHAGEQLPRHRP